MRAVAIIRAALLLLAALILLGMIAFLGFEDLGGSTYSLGQVETGLRMHPGQWVGKSIKLRARVLPIALPCPVNMQTTCGLTYTLIDPDQPSAAGPTLQSAGPAPSGFLLLDPAPGGTLLTDMRKIPVLSGLLPNPQPLAGIATLRVTLRRAVPSYLCLGPCYQAILPDAAVSDS